MKVTLLSYTASPDRLVAAAAKLCYANSDVGSLYDNLTDEKADAFVEMLSDLGHESPIEHASFTFGIEGVSRSLLAQLTRHRIASFSVQSQRYVRLENFSYITPPAFLQDARAKEIFERAMERDAEDYRELTAILSKQYEQEYAAEGLDEKNAKNRAEKRAIEDARFVLPNACETKLIVTMNARELKHFFSLRCCTRAQWEIRALANEMLRSAYEAAPKLFKNSGPPCLTGRCPEGKMSCGRADEMKEFYNKLKAGEDI